MASGKDKDDEAGDAEEPSTDEAAKKTGSIFGRVKSMFGKKTEEE